MRVPDDSPGCPSGCRLLPGRQAGAADTTMRRRERIKAQGSP